MEDTSRCILTGQERSFTAHISLVYEVCLASKTHNTRFISIHRTMLVVRFSDGRGQGIYKSSHLCSIHLTISFNDLTRTPYFLQTMHCSPLATLLTFVVLVEPLFAYQTIARRGLFHDVNDHNALAENSVNAMYRAEALGLPGVELISD